jgi:hypothetical protein
MAFSASLIRRLKQQFYNRRFRAEVRAAGRRTDVQGLMPDFLGIGTARSASTWLYSRLSQHPDVYLPELKELHFFNERRSHAPCAVSGATWTRPLYFDLDDPAHWRWYSLQFAPGAGKVRGEITPDYSTLSLARVGEVKRHLPEVKIILLIRNPIDRAWSGLRYSWKRHLDVALKPADVDRLMRAALHPERLLRGDYPMTIRNWEAHFPADRRLYLFYDDVAAQPRCELDRVATFLELDPAKLPRQNEAHRVNDAPAETISPEVRERLRAHYEPQIRWLQDRFGRDLSGWLE